MAGQEVQPVRVDASPGLVVHPQADRLRQCERGRCPSHQPAAQGRRAHPLPPPYTPQDEDDEGGEGGEGGEGDEGDEGGEDAWNNAMHAANAQHAQARLETMDRAARLHDARIGTMEPEVGEMAEVGEMEPEMVEILEMGEMEFLHD